MLDDPDDNDMRLLLGDHRQKQAITIHHDNSWSRLYHITPFVFVTFLIVALFFVVRINPSDETPVTGVTRPSTSQEYIIINWHHVCGNGGSAFDDIVHLTQQRYSQNETASRSSISISGTSRLMRALMIVMCGGSITVGVVGTSISAGQGVDGNVHQAFGYRVYEWLSQIPPILLYPNQTEPMPPAVVHGFVNAGLSAMGSDLVSLCFDSLFHYQLASTTEWNVVPGNNIYNTTDGFNARQYAERDGTAANIPDILFVEFVANDYEIASMKHSPLYWDTQQRSIDALSDDELELSSASRNMQALVEAILQYPVTAPFLVNTMVFDRESRILSSAESYYDKTIAIYDLPSVSWIKRWLVPKDSTTTSTSTTLATDIATSRFIRKMYWGDDVNDMTHPNKHGHNDIASMIIQKLSTMMVQLQETIEWYQTLAIDDTIMHSTSRHINEQKEKHKRSGRYCMWWAQATMNTGLIENAAHTDGFTRNTHFTLGNYKKRSWDAERAGSDLRIQVHSLLDNRQHLPRQINVGYVCGYDKNRGSALIWSTAYITITLTDVSSSRVPTTISDVHLTLSESKPYTSHWAAQQTTLVIKQLPMLNSGSRKTILDVVTKNDTNVVLIEQCLSVGDKQCILTYQINSIDVHVQTLDDGLFAFVGVIIDQ